ncbi:GAP family protein [Microbacterium resistens]|uniref:GAP family protein n=1 Tax=Microbacterium resistens TaxID=156977 RepID=A0ABY3RNY7_9MICO|nr:GAP family protein [Microbacterium resistens]UGS25622.1 GAP family protein [Microbacterium resistens]
MELLADSPLALTLAVLALLDGLSVGTLLIPVFLLLSPGRVRVGRILLYLGSITAFYLVIGLLFLWGLVNLVDVAADFFASTPGMILRLVVGAGLLIGSFFIPGSKKKEATVAVPTTASASSLESAGADRPLPGFRPSVSDATAPPGSAYAPPPVALSGSAGGGNTGVAEEAAATPRPGRLVRWREKLLDPSTPPLTVIGVAIAAGLVEVATMLPYIVAMTMLADAGYGTPVRVAALAGYCLLMIAPALILLVLRIVAARQIEGPLRRLGDWLARTGGETTAWIVGIVGFLILRAAVTDLRLFEALDRLT